MCETVHRGAKSSLSTNLAFLNVSTQKERRNFAERSKILLNTDLKILLDNQNNFVGTLKNNEQCCKKF